MQQIYFTRNLTKCLKNQPCDDIKIKDYSYLFKGVSFPLLRSSPSFLMTSHADFETLCKVTFIRFLSFHKDPLNNINTLFQVLIVKIVYFLQSKYFCNIWKTSKLAHENKNLPKLCLIDFSKIWNLMFNEKMVSAYLDTGLDSFLDEVSDNLFKLGSGQLQVHVLGA